MKEILKVSGILNIVLSSIYLFLSMFLGVVTLTCFLLLLVSGIIFLEYSKLNELDGKRDIIFVLSILLIPICFPSALMNLIALNSLCEKKSRAPNEQIDPETKKIDILIKVGIGLISLSGIIFISTGWNDLSKYVVISFLVILTVIFYMLYLLFTKKIKLVSSSKLYYILTHIFILIIFLSLGHYELLGSFFSTNGVGSNLFYSVFFMFSSILTYNLKDYVNKDIKNYTICLFMTLSVINILKFIDFTLIQSLVLLNLLSLFIWFKFKKNEYLNNYANILSKIFIFISGLCLTDGYSVSLLILIVLNIIVVNVLNIKSKSILYEILSPIVTLLYSGTIVGELLYFYNLEFSNFLIIFSSFIVVLYILISFTKILKNRCMSKNIFVVLLNVIMFVLNILFMIVNDNSLICILILDILYLFSYYYFIYRNDKNTIEYYIVPFNITILMVSSLVYINNFVSLDANIVLLSIIGVLSIYYLFIKNKVLNMIVIIFMLVFNVINVFISLDNSNIVIISLTLVSTSLPFILLSLKYSNDSIRFSFIYAILTQYIVLLNDEYSYVVSFIINMILYLLLLLIVIKDKTYYKYVALILSLPILTFIDNININYVLSTIINNIVLIYASLVFICLYIKNINTKRTLFIIFNSFIILGVIFRSNYIFGIYVGILSLFLLIYSSIKEYHKSIFTFSLVIFLINILYRLKDLWSEIPLWFYLLAAGITIIVFATLKELKKINKEKK